MTNLEHDQATAASIRRIRQEQQLTTHEVAVAIEKRTGRPDVLAAVADHLAAEAGTLRAMECGRSK